MRINSSKSKSTLLDEILFHENLSSDNNNKNRNTQN